MTDSVNYLRGAFVVYEPGGYPDRKYVIPFRFNPESLSRQFAVEPAQSAGAGPGTGKDAGAGAPGEQGADASSGSLKETFSVQIRVDMYDRVTEGGNVLPAALGVSPEIAALETLLQPVETAADAPSDGSEPTRAHPRRPTVLFVWGRKRVWPVRITAMTINETLHDAALEPVRAEIDVSCEVLGEGDVKENVPVGAALAFTAAARKALAASFIAGTTVQSAKVALI